MSQMQLGIYPLSYDDVTDLQVLKERIYPDMRHNYYWSDDFSPEFYIAQAQAGFIAVTDTYEGKELLLPEIQFSYMLLHFDELHISTKVRKILKKDHPRLHISTEIVPVVQKIQQYHQNCWLTDRYLHTLLQTQHLHENFQLIAVYIEKEKEPIAGEIGYIIGNTYTSLSGFSSREKCYRNYGSTQLVLLAEYLKEHGFAFWNLGQSYMPYKFHLGAKQYTRYDFLQLWYQHI
ncbi:MAG: GNAT family N-acetyltransferase [Sulfurovum sp.]|nr:GNAT family N-acetyltransferase [Sulfurovum sp.]